MAFEVSCSQCQGRLMVEQAGQVVACPHCGTHLAIPDAEPADVATVDSTAEPVSETQPVETEQQPEVPQPEATAPVEFPGFAQETQDEIPVFNPASEGASQNEPAVETDAAPDSTVDEPAAAATAQATASPDNPFAGGSPDFGVGFGSAPADGNPFSGGDFNFGDADAGSVTTVSEFVPAAVLDDGTESDELTSPGSQPTNGTSLIADSAPELGTFTAEASEDAAGVAGQLTPSENGTVSAVDNVPEPVDPAHTEPSEPAAYLPPAVSSPDSVPRSKYMLVLSWASAATIAALFLAYLLTTSQTSQLESLPDVKPPKKDDKIVYKLVPEEAAMPPGHVLALGDTQRYGNLKVTALRVTRGPVQFEHYDASSSRTKDDGPEVLKLWLKFENVSSDQSIAPLDELVFQRDDRDFENVRANIFLARSSEKSKSGPRLMVYDLNTDGDWNLKGQQVAREIPPGGQLETYIPTAPEGISEVLSSDEELVWRVHFRKGYSPKNYGVTTVIEVTFNASDVMSDLAAPAASVPPAAEDESHKA